jgi:DNA-binding response OmpR family regulator
MPQSIKILIVDDEVDICYFLSRNLIKRNFAASFSHTLADAEKKIENEQPSIVLLDNHLPDGRGVEVLDKLVNRYPEMKIVMLTAHDSPEDRSKAYKNGASYFLSKPFTLTEINNVIDLLLDRNPKVQKLQ